MKECANCGYQMGDQVSRCKYCGTANPSFKKESKPNFDFSFKSTDSKTSSESSTTNKNDFNVLIFIILIIVFWPAGLIYLVVKQQKK